MQTDTFPVDTYDFLNGPRMHYSRRRFPSARQLVRVFQHFRPRFNRQNFCRDGATRKSVGSVSNASSRIPLSPVRCFSFFSRIKRVKYVTSPAPISLWPISMNNYLLIVALNGSRDRLITVIILRCIFSADLCYRNWKSSIPKFRRLPR